MPRLDKVFMSNWTSEEIAGGLERWLRVRRNEAGDDRSQDSRWIAIDNLLNEVRDLAAEGWLPWQRVGHDGQ